MSKTKIQHMVDLLSQARQKSHDAQYSSRQAGIFCAAWLNCRNVNSPLAKKRMALENEWRNKQVDESSIVSMNIHIVSEWLEEMTKG